MLIKYFKIQLAGAMEIPIPIPTIKQFVVLKEPLKM